MKKNIQESINKYVESAAEVFASRFDIDNCINRGRLRYCNAHVLEDEYYIILVSYSTIVAFVEKDTGYMFDILRLVYGYTLTSAQHIAKFQTDFCRFCVRHTYRPV